LFASGLFLRGGRRDYLFSVLGVGRKNTEVSQHISAWLRDQGTHYLLGRDSPKKRGASPTGKAKMVLFEAVSKLPRHQQKKIIDVVESFVAQHFG
jgi:hypothetical protein